jgi:DNA-binding response OmpR family regulator
LLGILRGLGHAVPVVLFCERADLAAKRGAREAGATALLPRPADPAAFIALVRELLFA